MRPSISTAVIDRGQPRHARLLAAAQAIALAVPLLLLAALIAALFSVRPVAAQDAACGATDLVAELKVKDPAGYEKLRLEGAKIKNSGNRFWKLEKPGQQPNWLLGTMHVSDPRVTNLPDAARGAFENASTVVFESDELIDPQRAAAALMTRPELLYFSGTESILDHLDGTQEAQLEAGLVKRGMALGAVSKLKPWMLMSMVALSTCEMSRRANGETFLDMKLAQAAAAAGKPVKGVETMAEQLEAMASLPMDFHVSSLVAAVLHPDYTANMMETTLKLYLKGDIGMVFPAGAYFAPAGEAYDSKGMALFEEKLITIRNHHMADRGAPILAEGNVFMAVGALHLVGDEGLVELFRKKGYTATAVD